MRYNSVLLVSFYYSESGYGEKLLYPPLGMGYVAEYLKTHGTKISVLDMGTGKGMENAESLVSERIDKFHPELLAFSLNSICFSRSIWIIQKIHKKYPQIPIAIGGAHASSKGSDLLKEYPFLDYIVLREGEKPMGRLCAGDMLEDIPGLCWREGATIHENKAVPSEDLSEFPFPKYEEFELDRYGDQASIGILTSRGCPYLCAFCQQSSLLGKRWRGRTAEDLVNEISYWKSRGKKRIYIIDDNFAMDRQRVFKISDLVVKNKLNDMDYVLVGGIRVNQTDEEILKALKKMDVRVVPFGIESGSNKILKFINKGITAEQADHVIGLATSMGFDVKLFFIIGFPTETMDDIQKSFDLALKYPIASVRFFNLVPYKDTPIMDWLEKNDVHFYYPYDEFMNNFKRFQRIPLFECAGSMSVEEKTNALKKADEVVKLIEDKIRARGKTPL